VIERLRELQIPSVMGNHDNYLLNPELTKNHIPRLRATELWCLEQLATDDLDFLRSFQPQLSFNLDPNTTLLCYHGSPRSYEEFLYPNTPAETLDEIFGGQTAKVLIGGHTHVQMVTQHYDMTLINPGSVGTPFEHPASGIDRRIHRRAEYAVVDMTDGGLTINLHRLPIDFDQLAATARANGLPDVENWLSTWIP
ncbi:MAG TPA: metallophosphoesterase family protein, partial [Anaerolineales bacterium]|nr:metallophosphoesterase family protein [Anaerolineales bacterium]